MPKITINEREIEVATGTTVIQAAEQAGIEVPHYCYHPDLPVDGNCRMCLVEVEKMPKLTPSCTTLATDGMVVRTNSDRVKEAVRGVLEFLLINHPVDCPVCDQAGECRLQDYYMVYGLHTSHIPLEMKVRKRKVVDLGPMVVLDSERCVLCSRCIRFCDTVTGTGEMQFFGRGDHVEIGTFEDRPLDNPYSGNVVDICPVGALTSRDFRFKCRVWFLNSTDSVCAGCSAGCNVRIDHRDGAIFRIVPRRNVEVNKSWLCDEGRLSFHRLDDGERVALPAAAGREGVHAPVSWGDAIDSAHKRLSEVSSTNGPGSILGVASPSATNEALYLLKKYMSVHLGVTSFEFRLDSEDEKAAEREDNVLRFLDKHPNTTGAMKLGLASRELGGIEGAISAARSGKIRAAVVMHHKPLVCRPGDDAAAFSMAELLRALDYSVLLASRHEDWHSAASLILPISVWSEEEGTYTNQQGRVQSVFQAIAPAPEILPAAQVFAALIKAAGGSQVGRSPREIFSEMTENEAAFSGLRWEQTRLPGVLAAS
ncbi:MAG TPA: 2Fe-2S iron-sulfur cluster-binding protein [Blastocatellia bacterium]|nr:2Fe-2S iron-sulfur cluster-binding protein [Blastocatellia bacterium]